MSKSGDENDFEKQKNQKTMLGTSTAHQRETNHLPATINSLVAKSKNFSRQKLYVNDGHEDSCHENKQGARYDEKKQQHRLKKRQLQKLKAKCENYDYDICKSQKSIADIGGISVKMPSAPSITSVSYSSTSTLTSSSASSLSSDSVSSNTTTFINNCSKKDKKTSVINNNCNKQKIYQQQHTQPNNQQSPSDNFYKREQQMPNIEKISQLHDNSKTDTTVKQIPTTHIQERQMHYNQQVKCYHGNECTTTHTNRDL